MSALLPQTFPAHAGRCAQKKEVGQQGAPSGSQKSVNLLFSNTGIHDNSVTNIT